MATQYYTDQLNAGQQYEQFIYAYLESQYGLKVNAYTTKEEQYTKGENDQGIEVKFNSQATVYNCLYIEVAEKSNARNANYVPSGIYRVDNTTSLLMGDYKKAWQVDKKVLQELVESKRFKRHQSATSIGYTISTDIIAEHASRILTFASDITPMPSQTPQVKRWGKAGQQANNIVKTQPGSFMASLKARQAQRFATDKTY